MFNDLCCMFLMPSTTVIVGKRHYVYSLSVHCIRSFIHLSRQILLPLYLMNKLTNLDETYREHLLTHTEDLIRFRRSTVKVTASTRGKIVNAVSHEWRKQS